MRKTFKRIRGDLTQEELAKRSGVGRPTIASLETQRKSPAFHTVARIARALGVSLDTIAQNEPTVVELATILAEVRAVRTLLEAVLVAVEAPREEAGPQPNAD